MRAKLRQVGALLCASVAAAGVMVAVDAQPAAAVVGGTPSSSADYPYFASFTQPFGFPPSCGGSVIADSWVLTAAHCVDDRSTVSVYLPAAHVDATGDVILHPLWTPGSSEGTDGHDVALVRLAAGTAAGATVVQVGAPWDPAAYAAGNLATIMGTGDTFAHDPAHGSFLAADTVLRSDDYMDDIFNPWWGFDNWHEALMIGAGSTNQTVCRGDSGSPLVVSRATGTVQVGVASFIRDGNDCHGAAGFAELSGPQLAWIASQVPSIMDHWGTCTAPGGAVGQSRAGYGSFVPGFQWDGPVPWNIWCEGPPASVTVPDVRGDTVDEAFGTLRAVGLEPGSVASRSDPTCAYIGVVMSSSPSRGTVVSPGSVVNVTLGQQPKNSCV